MHRSQTESWITLAATGMLLLGGTGCVGSAAPTEGGNGRIGEDWWSSDDDDDDAFGEPAEDSEDYYGQEPADDPASCTNDCSLWCVDLTVSWCDGDGNTNSPCECGESEGPGSCTDDCSVWCEDVTTSWCDGDGNVISSPCSCGGTEAGGSGECEPACDLNANSAITCQDGAEVVEACPRGWTCSFVDAQGRHADSANVAVGPACLSCADAGQLSCDDGSGCYFSEWVCDGYVDCENESDETDC